MASRARPTRVSGRGAVAGLQQGQGKATAQGPQQGDAGGGEQIPEQVAEIADQQGILEAVRHAGQAGLEPPDTQAGGEQAMGETPVATQTGQRAREKGEPLSQQRPGVVEIRQQTAEQGKGQQLPEWRCRQGGEQFGVADQQGTADGKQQVSAGSHREDETGLEMGGV